jgi:membrane protein required for colicin V production
MVKLFLRSLNHFYPNHQLPIGYPMGNKPAGLIDIVTFLVLALAVFKGIRNGLVMAVFSFIALFLGVLAALKLSATTAIWLEDTVQVSARWLPLLSFLLVFIVVVILVNMIGKLLEKTTEWAFLGWANKAGGIVFYAVIYLLIWSLFIFYLDKLSLISQEAMESSVTYPIIAPWGPDAVDWIASVIPVFKDIMTEIGGFLERFSEEKNPDIRTV